MKIRDLLVTVGFLGSICFASGLDLSDRNFYALVISVVIMAIGCIWKGVMQDEE